MRARFYRLVDLSVLEAIEPYVAGEDAERALAAILADEPGWEMILRVDSIDLGGDPVLK